MGDMISRKAAIEALQNHYEVRNPKQNAIMDECVMLISNVPSVQTEKMQLSKEDATKGTTFDCIDRKVAIDALDALCDRECEYSKQQRSFMCGACRLGSAFDVIDELPSAQPEHTETHSCDYRRTETHEPQRMRGKWETIEGWDGDEVYRCSECGEEYVLIDGTPKENGYHFCPNCGARMSEGEEDE